nr:hypothetical protein [Tanacetum cinerariifolium]
MYVPNFTFQYRVENSELVATFWADEVAKCNYKEFGDIISFDAIFNSNNDSSGISCDSFGIPLNLLRYFNLMRFQLNLMYNMKFVPFIGIDNHRKCVTLGLEMLLHEDTKSYTWLLNAFMFAFSHDPTMTVTDQDGAMKRVIKAVFNKAKHRLCMWRMMQIIPSKQYILRRWTRDIIPPDLRRQRNRYGEKSLTIERLTNKANFLVDDSLFLLSKDEGKMGAYVEKLKILLDEMKADMPNPPLRNTGDVIGGIFSITKPNQIVDQNLTKAVNKEEHLKKEERLKSEREKALKVGKKKLRVCGFCKEKINEHTKTTCLLNPKAKKGRRHQLLMFKHFLVT